jgi:predicted amidohydrolase YtcJ
VHSIGDAATRAVLDALETAYAATGAGDRRDVLTHLQLIRAEDMDRMKNLGVIASFQPFWHFKEPNWYDQLDELILGRDRALTCYPVASCLRRGIPIVFSGDFPVVSENDPFMAIETAVTRNLNRPESYGVDEIEGPDDPLWLRNPGERVNVMEAIRAYTENAAYALFRENEIGSLIPGKYADFIVTDRDPTTVPSIDIDKTRVTETWIGGERVYES